MSDLVQQSENAPREVARVEPEAKSHISRPDQRAERMMSGVDSARTQIETKRCSDALAKQPLPVERKLPREQSRARGPALAAQRVDQRGELHLQAREQFRQPRGRHARLIVVEKRIVARSVVANGIRFLARQSEDLVEPGGKRPEVVFPPRIGPDLRGKRCHTRGLLDESSGQAPLAIVFSTKLADIDGLWAFGISDERRALDDA